MKLQAWDPDLRTIVDRIESGDIDLQPDFQRQEVWPLPKKKKLIDTVLREWSIPPIFLVVSSEGRMDVLDGQQRLAAIRDFFENQFAVDGDIDPYDVNIAGMHGNFYKDLDPVNRRMLDRYDLRCFKITDYDPDEPSELFYRLNQPTRLTPGEQRNAFYGPARDQLKDLVAYFESLGNARDTIGFSNARLAYDDIIARILFFCERRTFAVKSTEAVISSRFKAKAPFDPEAFEQTRFAIKKFSEARYIAASARLNKASSISWLLFFARYTGGEGDLRFFQWFVDSMASVIDDPRIEGALELFRDRASLRVTDVSSVVLRDFCLWYAFYIGSGQSPSAIPSTLLGSLQAVDAAWHAADMFPEKDFEDIVVRHVDLELWANLS